MRNLKLWREHNAWVVDRFADDLAERLGRPAEEIRQTGLLDREFPAERVRVYHDSPDAPDALCDFRFAFCVASKRSKTIGVFTNHAGYFVFSFGCTVSLAGLDGSEERFIYTTRDWNALLDAP